MVRRHPLVGLAVGFFCSAYAGEVRAEGIDLRGWLDRPGVRLVAVEFYATWCKPCMEAVPKWKALHDRYRERGLRLIVVATQDPDGSCISPPWTPDELVCDAEGDLARAWGANKLPSAFLWSWQGKLLSRGEHVEGIERAVERFMREAPRISVDVPLLPKSAGIEGSALAELVRSRLRDGDKLTVLATEEEQRKLRALKLKSYQARFDEALACELGQELSANALLSARISDSARPRLHLSLLSAEKGCLVASAAVDWSRARASASVGEGVAELLGKLRPRVEMPGAHPTSSVDIQVPKVLIRAPSAKGLGGINLAVEKRLDEALGLEERKGASPEAKAAAWCALAAIEDRNPYLAKAKEACRSYWRYAIELTSRELEVLDDYTTLAGFMRLPRKSKEEKAASVRAFDEAHGALDGNVLVSAVRRMKPNDKLPAASALLERACAKEKDSHACVVFGLALLFGRGMDRDPERPISLFKKACEAGNAAGCFEQAWRTRNGEGIAKDEAAARAMFEQACRSGHPNACGEAAGLALLGIGGPRDVAKAAALSREVCDADWPLGCRTLGWMHFSGSGLELDRAKAHGLFDRACKQGDVSGCEGLAWTLRNGDGVPADPAKAFEMFRSGCEAGHGGPCNGLGHLYKDGVGVARDGARALEAFTRGCELGHPWSCESAGLIHASGEAGSTNLALAADFYRRACEGNAIGGCMHLGFAFKDGFGVARDEPKAVELLTRVCELGDPGSCGHVAWMYREGRGVPVDLRRAYDLFRRDCDREGSWNAWVCKDAGDMAVKGLGIPKDRARADRDYARAFAKLSKKCAAFGGWECFHLGDLYNRGLGVPVDHAKARDAFQRSCDGGVGVGCALVGWYLNNGTGAPADHAKAAEYFERACDLREGGACLGMSNLLLHGNIGHDATRSASFAKRACELANGWGCWNLALAQRDGNGVAKDDAEAAKSAQRAREIFGAWAAGGNADGLHGQGALLMDGVGGAKDPARAAPLLAKACEGDVGWACWRIALLAQEGNGVPKDEARAKQSFQRACGLGVPVACDRAR